MKLWAPLWKRRKSRQAGRSKRRDLRRSHKGLLLASLAAALLPCCTIENQHARAPAVIGKVASHSFTLPAPGVSDTPLRVTVLLPPAYAMHARAKFRTLYVNDGQDAQAVALPEALQALAEEPGADAPMVIAIDAPADRMGAYGLSNRATGRSVVAQSKYGPVGAKAQAYSQWVATTLVPHVNAHYRTRADARSRAVLGWSVGALNAFDLGWQYPDMFATIGAFSPSFWAPADKERVQRTRLAQAIVERGPRRANLRMFVAVGTDEETGDRDDDGVIDAVDDARDLVLGWDERCEDPGGSGHGRELFSSEPKKTEKARGHGRSHTGNPNRGRFCGQRGLAQLGYSVDADFAAHPSRSADIVFALIAGGRHQQASWKRMLPAFLDWAYGSAPLVAPSPLASRPAGDGVTGTLRTLEDIASRNVETRRVDVWLPPDYDANPQQRYPVLYLHDGQNLFDPKTSYTGVDWGVDETMTRLIAAGRVRPAIVVGIWNSPRRFAEYMPQRAASADPVATGVEGFAPVPQRDLLGDAYLKYLVDELKPAIDRRFRTLPGRADTVVMGSSMGGLISLYAIARYPQVFGGAGAMSTHWPAADGAMVDWFARHLPEPRTHRLYFDHGTATLDAAYAPYQRRMDASLARGGYRQGVDWISRIDPGGEHSETAWRKRVDVPLEFLLRP